ncbi:MAG: hypothetical protein J7J78_02265 [Thermoprotei archaeon]|nr:hypothetical protein [Thermoprotei archaeon]
MANERVIDLTGKSSECREHPVLDLTKSFNTMSKGEKIRFIVDPSEIPLDVVEALAKVRNIEINVIESSEKRLIFVATKK